MTDPRLFLSCCWFEPRGVVTHVLMYMTTLHSWFCYYWHYTRRRLQQLFVSVGRSVRRSHQLIPFDTALFHLQWLCSLVYGHIVEHWLCCSDVSMSRLSRQTRTPDTTAVTQTNTESVGITLTTELASY